MLCTRDPPQNERYTNVKRKGIEKLYFMQVEMEKKSLGSSTFIWQNRLYNKGYGKRQRRALHNDKGNNPTRGYNPSKHLHTDIGHLNM